MSLDREQVEAAIAAAQKTIDAGYLLHPDQVKPLIEALTITDEMVERAAKEAGVMKQTARAVLEAATRGDTDT